RIERCAASIAYPYQSVQTFAPPAGSASNVPMPFCSKVALSRSVKCSCASLARLLNTSETLVAMSWLRAICLPMSIRCLAHPLRRTAPTGRLDRLSRERVGPSSQFLTGPYVSHARSPNERSAGQENQPLQQRPTLRRAAPRIYCCLLPLIFPTTPPA